MSLQLTPDCLDTWLKDYESFKYAFLRYQNFVVQSIGYSIDPDFKGLKGAHEAWCGQCSTWQSDRMVDPAKHLSPLKVLALLLHELSEISWIKEIAEFDEEAAPAPFAGTEEEKEELRRDVAGGEGTYLAFEFVTLVINWFERARTDRIQGFTFRMTLDLAHDIMFYLQGKQKDPTAIYLILKALYARDPTPDAPNN